MQPGLRFHVNDSAQESWRSHAQIDIDRISYSTEFRRLAGVTQVVPPRHDHLLHDRLTHSIKVAQVAATLARRLLKKNENLQGVESLSQWVDPEHCYAAGLAHDIGHPPFGHAGEKAIQQVLEGASKDWGSRSFEGNAQSMRIVASLSFRKEDISGGLDLTLRSLAGLAKYPWLRGGHPAGIPKLADKWSFYPEEAEILSKLRDEGYLAVETEGRTVVAVHRWPEAEIMDWADDISYAVHDVDDFFRAGQIPLHRISTALKNAPTKIDWTATDFSFAGDDEETARALAFVRRKLTRIPINEGRLPTETEIGNAFDMVSQSLRIHFPVKRFDGSRQSQTSIQKFGSQLISALSDQCFLSVVSVHGKPRVTVGIHPVGRLVAEFFKALCRYFVIESSTLSTLQAGHAKNVETMYRALYDLASSWTESADRLVQARSIPSRLREYLRSDVEAGKSPEERLHISVVDYMCSLRDEQAVALTARFRGQQDGFGMSAGWLDA
jgi:dGTPase